MAAQARPCEGRRCQQPWILSPCLAVFQRLLPWALIGEHSGEGRRAGGWPVTPPPPHRAPKTVASAVYTPNRHRQDRPGRSIPRGLPSRSAGEVPMMAVLDPEALLGLDDATFREVVNQHMSKR